MVDLQAWLSFRRGRGKLAYQTMGFRLNVMLALGGAVVLHAHSQATTGSDSHRGQQPDPQAQRCSALGTGSTAVPDSFLVASIRPVPEAERGTMAIGNYGLPHFQLTGFSLVALIAFAYDIDQPNLVGLPKGAGDTPYKVQVACGDGFVLTYERAKPLLQELLRQRFGLVAHTGTKQVQGFALVVGKAGSKLVPATSGEGSYFNILRTQLRSVNTSLATFVRVLPNVMGRPVTDETGLHGNYNITVNFSPVDDPDPKYPSISTALREQLGLELKPTQVSVPTLVISQVDLKPTEN